MMNRIMWGAVLITGALISQTSPNEDQGITREQMSQLLMFQDRQPPEEGKPMSCDNYKQTPESHKCHCARDKQECGDLPQPPADVEMDKKCLTYCRKQNCKCAGRGCRS